MLDEVLKEMCPGMSYTSSDGSWENVVFEDERFVKPAESEYEYRVYKLTNVEALRRMREERTVLLSESDKYMTLDYPHRLERDLNEWKEYRRVLRDLPRKARPTLDEEGKLVGIEWPTPPS